MRCLSMGRGQRLRYAHNLFVVGLVDKSLYHLVFEITAIAFPNPALGLDGYWFLSWPLVLDWIRTLEIGFGLVSRAPGLLLDWFWRCAAWIGFGLVLDWF